MILLLVRVSYGEVCKMARLDAIVHCLQQHLTGGFQQFRPCVDDRLQFGSECCCTGFCTAHNMVEAATTLWTMRYGDWLDSYRGHLPLTVVSK